MKKQKDLQKGDVCLTCLNGFDDGEHTIVVLKVRRIYKHNLLTYVETEIIYIVNDNTGCGLFEHYKEENKPYTTIAEHLIFLGININ